MIAIGKNLADIPPSLMVPPLNRSATSTHRVREKVIAEGAYPSGQSAVDSRYKMEDIKRRLFDLYNGKCAFCEQRVERWQVEHFRPKSIYYWLAFSWDNLLYACPDCNGSKSNRFDLSGAREVSPPADLTQINLLSEGYDVSEQPLFFCPERGDPQPLLVFRRDGWVESTDERCAYTLDTCKVGRPYLNDYRKAILDDFENDLKSEAAALSTRAEIEQAVQVLIRKFNRDAENPKNEYVAFRKYALRHLVPQILGEVLGAP